jgi:cyanate permease
VGKRALIGPSGLSKRSLGSERIAWRVILPAFLATTAGILPGFLNAGLAVQIRADLGLSLSRLGALIGLFFAVSGLVSPVAGRWSERLGWATSLRISVSLSALSLLGIAWLGRDLPTLSVFLVIGGIGGALGQVSSNLAVARCVAGERLGFVFGLRHASVPAAAALAGAAVPGIALTVGWRWAFVGGALLAVIAGVAVPASEQRYSVNSPTPAGASPGRPATSMKLLVILSIAVGVGIAGVDGFTAFLVSYSVDIGFGETSAGLLLTVGSITGMTARLVFGWLIDFVHWRDLTTIAAMMAIGGAGVVVLNLGGTTGLLVGGMVVFAAGWGWSGLFTYAVVRANPGAPASASGVTQVGKYFGAATGPPLFGFIAENASFHVAYWFTTSVLVLAAFLILYVRNQRVNE